MMRSIEICKLMTEIIVFLKGISRFSLVIKRRFDICGKVKEENETAVSIMVHISRQKVCSVNESLF